MAGLSERRDDRGSCCHPPPPTFGMLVLFKLSSEVTLFIIRKRVSDVILVKTQPRAGNQSAPGLETSPAVQRGETRDAGSGG